MHWFNTLLVMALCSTRSFLGRIWFSSIVSFPAFLCPLKTVTVQGLTRQGRSCPGGLSWLNCSFAIFYIFHTFKSNRPITIGTGVVAWIFQRASVLQKAGTRLSFPTLHSDTLWFYSEKHQTTLSEAAQKLLHEIPHRDSFTAIPDFFICFFVKLICYVQCWDSPVLLT